jgi:hypothetical protein
MHPFLYGAAGAVDQVMSRSILIRTLRDFDNRPVCAFQRNGDIS